MPRSAFDIAIDAIALYREYVERYDFSPEEAATAAALEVQEGEKVLEEEPA